MEANNTKAMREALAAITCINTGSLKRLLYELVESDIPGGGQINKIISAVDKAKAALSAPARNCEVYQNKKDAEDAFLSEECRHPCGNCTVSDEYGCALVHECGVD